MKSRSEVSLKAMRTTQKKAPAEINLPGLGSFFSQGA